jgi:hypothetical protein
VRPGTALVRVVTVVPGSAARVSVRAAAPRPRRCLGNRKHPPGRDRPSRAGAGGPFRITRPVASPWGLVPRQPAPDVDGAPMPSGHGREKADRARMEAPRCQAVGPEPAAGGAGTHQPTILVPPPRGMSAAPLGPASAKNDLPPGDTALDFFRKCGYKQNQAGVRGEEPSSRLNLGRCVDPILKASSSSLFPSAPP